MARIVGAPGLDHLVDAVIAGECGTEPTTVLDLSQPSRRSCAAALRTSRIESPPGPLAAQHLPITAHARPLAAGRR